MNIRLKHILILVCIFISGALFAKSDIEIVKQRVIAEILLETVGDEEISALIHSMGEDGSWPEINYEDPSRSLSRMHLQITGMNDLSIELPEGVYAGQSINTNL